MYLRCDICQKAFATKKNIRIEKEGDIERIVIQCPHCGACTYGPKTNSEIREQQRLVFNLGESIVDKKSLKKYRIEKNKLAKMLLKLNPKRDSPRKEVSPNVNPRG